MAEDAVAKEQESQLKAIVAAHESVAHLLSIFIPLLAVLFVGFQNADDTLDLLGAKFETGQGAVVAVMLIIVACYFCARNLFVMRNLLESMPDQSAVRRQLQTSAVLLNPFTEVTPPFAGRLFNYSALVLMHIAPLGVVLGFSDLIVASQRSLLLATCHFLLVLLFAAVYFFFCIGLTLVIEFVNPADAVLRKRIVHLAILTWVIAFLVYGYVANLENFRAALQM